jgi:hypothetical protein
MNVVEDKPTEIKILEPKVKLLGISKDGNIALNFKDANENIDEDTIKLSFIQTPHVIETGNRFSKELGNLEYVSFEYDKLKLFDLSAKEKIITFAATKDSDNEQIVKTVSNQIINPNEIQNTKSYPINTSVSSYDNPWQNYILNCIEYMKEVTISSIQMNEKTLMSFWKKFNK